MHILLLFPVSSLLHGHLFHRRNRRPLAKEDAVEGRRIAPLPPGPPLAPPRFLRLCHCKTAWKSARLIELCSSGTRDDSLHINISLTACNHSFSNISPHEQSLVLLQFLGFTPYFARIIVSCDYWGDFDYCDSIAIVVILLSTQSSVPPRPPVDQWRVY